MKSTVKLLLAGCLAFGVIATIWADVDPTYQAAMKGAAGACGRLKKGIDAKASNEDLAKEAEEVAHGFGKMEAYWKEHNADDAVTLAKQGHDAAVAAAKAAKAGNSDEVAAAFKNLTSTCGACHKAHRDKNADGSFSIK